ncbi:hypothetical protein QUF55_10110 [Clostridiaceae bacterium HSG29]|nr:hypothetical protein [Clostridiaceae bacterium HSG29]
MLLNNISKTIGTTLLLFGLIGTNVFADTITEYSTNIIKAEENHIEIVKTLYNAYNIPLPNINDKIFIKLPDSINYALDEDIKTEIANIAMYDSLLKEDLPTNISLAFETLKRDSESHFINF